MPTFKLRSRAFFLSSRLGKFIRHPLGGYTQGMNDIVAPIFSVFMAEKFGCPFFELENNLLDVESQFTPENLRDVY